MVGVYEAFDRRCYDGLDLLSISVSDNVRPMHFFCLILTRGNIVCSSMPTNAAFKYQKRRSSHVPCLSSQCNAQKAVITISLPK